MTTYDNKTNNTIGSGRYIILPEFAPCDSATFKASYIVASDIACDGKVTALFDLIVLGDFEAEELEVKGRFICIGVCKAKTIIVHDEIWAEKIIAASIETNSRITAQELTAKTLTADGIILVAQTLEVESTAESNKAIICGETIFGAGVISAPTVRTVEPLDLDDGEDAVISTSRIEDSVSESETEALPAVSHPEDTQNRSLIQVGESDYEPTNDYCGYLDLAVTKALDEKEVKKFRDWKAVLVEAESSCDSIDDCNNAVELIWLSEVANSEHFRNWTRIDDMFITLDKHYADLINNNSDALSCIVNDYSEWVKALNILHEHGDIISEEIYYWIYEQIISNIGLKPDFVAKRLQEKGWFIHA